MSTGFSRTLRTLQTDSSGFAFALALAGVVLLVAWSAWFARARLTILEVTEQARLEVTTAASPIESPVTGRVIETYVALGRAVVAGEVLLKLEAESQQLDIREQQAQVAGLAAEIAELRAQAAAEEGARAEERQSARVAVEQAIAGEREAAAPARYSSEEAQRLAQLRALGLISMRDYARATAEAERSSAAVDSSRIAIRRIEQEQRAREVEREARLRRLQAEIARAMGRVQTRNASIDRLRYEVERRVVRAPAAGRLGEVKTLRPGSVVGAGERLAAIIPDDRLRVVAQFPTPASIGRLRAGQPGRMRMHGFPWSQFGVVEATVTNVGSEIRDGVVRVELAVRPTTTLRSPMQHGMSGNLEVEVDRVSPAALLLRLAGRWLTEPLGKSVGGTGAT